MQIRTRTTSAVLTPRIAIREQAMARITRLVLENVWRMKAKGLSEQSGAR